MSDFTGYVVSTIRDGLGDQLAADAAAGATSLTLDDAADFNEDGGSLRLNGTVLRYLTVDDETGVVRLDPATPLPAATVTGDLVDVWDVDAGGVPTEVVAHVRVEGTELADDTLEAIVPTHLIPYFPEAIYEGDGIPVALEWRGQDLYVLTTLGRDLLFDGTMIDPDTLPSVEIPLPEAPTASPTLTVYGNPHGLVVEAVGVDGTAGLSLDYHISTTSGFAPGPSTLATPSTSSTVVNIEKLPDGSPLIADVTYYLKVIASNVSGTAPASPEVPGALRLIDSDSVSTLAASKIVAGDLIGAYALLGALNVGANISITPDQGIVISLDNGGIIKFPSDGSPAAITAELVALALTVKGALRILGTDNEVGQGAEVYLSDGVTDPVVAPTVTYGWPRLTLTGFANAGHADSLRTIGVEESAASMTSIASQYEGDRAGQMFLETINLTTGVVTRKTPTIEAFADYSDQVFAEALTKVGSTYYALVRDDGRSGGRYVMGINASGAKVSEFLALSSASMGGVNGIAGLVERNGELVAGYIDTSNHLVFKRFSTTGTLLGTHIVTGFTYPSAALAKRVKITQQNGTIWATFSDEALPSKFYGIIPYTTTSSITWTLQPSDNYPVAVDKNVTATMNVDSATPNYHIHDNYLWQYAGKFSQGSGTADPTLTDEFVYTYRDSNNGGTGQHETRASPTRQLVKYPNRATPIVNAPPLGVTTNADSVDSIRVYSRTVGGTAFSWDRWDPAPGVIQLQAAQDKKSSSAQVLPASNTFVNANLTPGSLKSGRLDTGGNLIDLRGDGSGRVGPLKWNALGKVGTPIEIPFTFASGWDNYGAGYGVVKILYYPQVGRVFMEGLAQRKTASSSLVTIDIGSIPAEWLPLASAFGAVWGSGPDGATSYRLSITATGVVQATASTAAVWTVGRYISFGGYSFIPATPPI